MKAHTVRLHIFRMMTSLASNNLSSQPCIGHKLSLCYINYEIEAEFP